MNEVLFRKHLKRVLSYGIPKDIAKEIVECAIETSNGNNAELYINYAIDLIYGFGFTKKYHAK